MSNFKFYDLVGILVPGALALLVTALVWSNWQATLLSSSISLGDLSLFVVLAYVAGQLVQTLGDGAECLYWRIWGGLPTDWVRTGRHELLGTEHLRALQRRIPLLLGREADTSIQRMTHREWSLTVRQMYAAVAAESRAGRVDTFNGIYALNRGLTCAFALGAILAAANNTFQTTPSVSWATMGLFLTAAVVTLLRMHRFAINYARELFLQFLQLPERIGEDSENRRGLAAEGASDASEPTHISAT